MTMTLRPLAAFACLAALVLGGAGSVQAQGAPKRVDPFAPIALATSKRAEPDLGNAERHELKLSASAAATNYDVPTSIQLADGRRIDLLDSLCSTAQTLWAIDGKTWPQMGHENLPPPLMSLRRGTSVRIELAS